MASWQNGLQAICLIAMANKGDTIHHQSDEAACYGRPEVVGRSDKPCCRFDPVGCARLRLPGSRQTDGRVPRIPQIAILTIRGSSSPLRIPNFSCQPCRDVMRGVSFCARQHVCVSVSPEAAENTPKCFFFAVLRLPFLLYFCLKRL